MNNKDKIKYFLKEFVLEFFKILIISLLIVVPIRYFLIQPFYVKGASMEPNFYDYEYLIIDEISYRFKQPQRGEIVVFHSSYSWQDYYIKRIIGLPKERIVIKDGWVYIYNEKFKEGIKLDESSYLEAGMTTPGKIDLILAEEEYFVLGDNRNSSLDSRSFGPVFRSQIVGKTWLRGWPPTRIKKFDLPVYNL